MIPLWILIVLALQAISVIASTTAASRCKTIIGPSAPWTNRTTASSTTASYSPITQNATSQLSVAACHPSHLRSKSVSTPLSHSSSLLADIGSLASPSSTGVSDSPNTGSSVNVTSTITSIPTGFRATTLSGTSYTSNGWITTTDEAHHTTLIPVLAIGRGLGLAFFNLPPIPHVEFALPGFPKFHLPCIKIFGICLGHCASTPVTNGSSTDNSPHNSHTDSDQSSTTGSSISDSSSSRTTVNTISNCRVQCLSTTTNSLCASYNTTCSQKRKGCAKQGTTSTVGAVVTVRSCTNTRPVSSCVQICNTVVQTSGTTTTRCATPSCTTLQGYSVTKTTSTVFVTSTLEARCFFRASSSRMQSSHLVEPTSCPLTKRTLALPGNDTNAFIEQQIKEAGASNLLELRGTPGDSKTGGLSSSKRFQFLDKAILTGAINLRGCTTVFIFSKQGMWEAHFWEIPSFEIPTLIVDDIIVKTETSPCKDFQHDVIDFIQDGDGPAYPGVRPDLENGGLFNTDILGIFIVTPKQGLKSDAQALRYPWEVNNIRQRLQRLLRVNNSVPIYTATYVPWPQAVPGKPYAIGTVLVQYDPQQMSTGADKATTLVRIYVDGVTSPDMTWDPLPNQIPQSGQTAAQVSQRDLDEREKDCTNGTTSTSPTTLLTTIMPAKAPTRSILTSPPVPMSYGVVSKGGISLVATFS